MSQFNDKVTPKDFVKMAPEYKDLLIRLLTIQADCEIGGPHIYVDHWTLRAPTVDDQWRVARIAAEEIDHCRKMLRLLGLLDIDRSDILTRPRSKREVDAFKEDMPTWADFAAFGMLIDKVGEYQLEEMNGSTYRPIEDYLAQILREEKGHISYGQQQLEKLVKSGDEGREQVVRHGRLEQHRRLDRSDLAASQPREGTPPGVVADGFRPRQVLRGTLRHVPVVALHPAVLGGDHRAGNRVPRRGKTFHEAVAVGEREMPLLARDAGALGVHHALVQAERRGLAGLRDLDRPLDGQIPGME